MTNNQKYNLFLDAVRIIRSLADVFEAIADTYRDATVVEADAKFIDAQEVKALPAEKEVRNFEDAAMKYKNIDHIVITTKNFEACLPIYVDILGMKA